MSDVDLNQLRELILRNQSEGQTLPVTREKQVHVDPQGRIIVGRVEANEWHHVSVIPQDPFAVSRLESESLIVRNKMPAGTQPLTVQGVTGWIYEITDEFRQRYQMYVYHDGSMYQVKVVTPEVEGKYSPHYGHLFSDGRICFGSAGGVGSLEEAYAKSVLWATGFTVFQQTGQFPFTRA